MQRDSWRRTEVGALWVFAEGEFDGPRGVVDRPFRCRPSPLPLHDLALPADRIRGAVQHQRGGRSSGQLAINIDVFVVDHVANADHSAVRQRNLVDAPLDRRVTVRVDDSRQNELPARVDHLRVRGRGDLIVRPDRGDLGSPNEHRAMLDFSVRYREDRGVADEDDIVRRGSGCEK